MLDPNKVNPPRPEGLPPRGVGVVDSQVQILENEKAQAMDRAATAEQDLRDQADERDALSDQVHQLRTDLQQSTADNEALKKKIADLEEDRREDADNLGSQLAKAQEKVTTAEKRIKELEAAEPVETEVEVFPRKVILSEVTNVRKKNDNLIVKGIVPMSEGEEDHNVLLRIPFDAVADVVKGA
jgi:hypothetical protein